MLVESLSFVGNDTSGEWPKKDLWMPKRSGDFAKDNETGRACFEEVQRYMRETGDLSFLSYVLRAQMRHGEWDGVEVGFAFALAESAV